MSGEPWIPLPPEQQLEPATCDVCGACRWVPDGSGWICDECDTAYDRDGERQLAKEQ